MNIAAIRPDDLAKILSGAFRRQITEQEVLCISEEGELLSGDGTINLIQYTAFLAGEVSFGSH